MDFIFPREEQAWRKAVCERATWADRRRLKMSSIGWGSGEGMEEYDI